MSNTPTSQTPSRKKTLLSVLVLLILTGVIVYIFKDNWADISAALAQLSVWQVLLVLAIGLSYPLLEGLASMLVMRSRLPQFTFRQAMGNEWAGVFANVAAFGVGTTPVQTYYLYRCGMPAGPAVGLLTLQYTLHKLTVLLYPTVLLIFMHSWLTANTSGVLNYLPLAYVVVAAIILALVLVCVSPAVQRIAHKLLNFLPKTEKWQARRESWQAQLDDLGTESRHLLADKTRIAKILAVQALKLFLMFTLPYLCLKFMGFDTALTFWQVQLLTSLMLFLSNALPNVAGMGSVETAFLLVFTNFLPQTAAMSILMLYRIATYYVVFAASAVGFFFAQKRIS